MFSFSLSRRHIFWGKRQLSVSVKKASEILGVSLGMIYKKIEAGKLEVKLIGSKKFVKKSAIMELNEKS